MQCTEESIGELEMDALVEAVASIYAGHDKHRSLWDVWCHALHHAAAIAEEIRKTPTGTPGDKLNQEVADLVLWIFTMLGKLRGTLGSPVLNHPPRDWIIRVSVDASNLMWNRYPGVCPWCYCATHRDDASPVAEAELCAPCRCDELRIAEGKKDRGELRARAQRTRKLARESASRKPLSLDGWQGLVGMLYGERLSHLSLEYVGLHLLEEMGEVSDALVRMYTYLEGESLERELAARQIRLEDEFADVLSWLFGLVERLNTSSSPQTHLVSGKRRLLSQILWGKYGSDELRSFWCRHCRRVVCNCRVLLIQNKEDVERLAASVAGGKREEDL
jgi:NTP pyrophosphatase (non-canonical NTP hydrolase)